MNKNAGQNQIPFKKICIISFFCCLMLLAVTVYLLIRGNYFSILKQVMSDDTYHYSDNASYIQRQTQFEMLPARNTDVVFLGDSITARFEWQGYFTDLCVSNRGIDSDVCEGVYNRLNTVINQSPKKIFIMIGINDVRQKIEMSQSVEFYQKTIETLQTELPDCKIYLQSVLPVSSATGIDNTIVQAFNAQIKELAQANSLTYIDLYSKVVNDHNDFTYTVDGVHPTGEGYQIWMDAISGYVYE